MRIVADDPSQLTLRDRTLWVSVICLVGAAAIVVGAVQHHARWTGFISAGLMVAFGLAFLRATDVVFDKARRACAVRRLDVFRVRRMDIPFDEIADVRVEPSPGGDDSGAISCRLALVAGGATHPLSASYEPDLARFERMRAQIVEAVFAGRPPPAETDPVMSLLAAGRRIDAIAFLRRRDGPSLAEARARVEALATPRQ